MALKKQQKEPSGRMPGSSNSSSSQTPQRPQMFPGRVWLFFLIILAMNYILGRVFAPDAEAPVKVPYTLFKQEVAADNVQAVFNKADHHRNSKAGTWP